MEFAPSPQHFLLRAKGNTSDWGVRVALCCSNGLAEAQGGYLGPAGHRDAKSHTALPPSVLLSLSLSRRAGGDQPLPRRRLQDHDRRRVVGPVEEVRGGEGDKASWEFELQRGPGARPGLLFSARLVESALAPSCKSLKQERRLPRLSAVRLEQDEGAPLRSDVVPRAEGLGERDLVPRLPRLLVALVPGPKFQGIFFFFIREDGSRTTFRKLPTT